MRLKNFSFTSYKSDRYLSYGQFDGHLNRYAHYAHMPIINIVKKYDWTVKYRLRFWLPTFGATLNIYSKYNVHLLNNFKYIDKIKGLWNIGHSDLW